MIRGTTPTLSLKLDRTKFDLSQITLSQIWLTIQSRYKEYNKTFDIDRLTIDTTNNKITLALTQAETLEMPNETLNVQLRMCDASGNAFATRIKSINVYRILKEGVIE